jgi:UDP-N-acetylmuramoyl-tripeptide--D-alanyl-D-alanine ligase
VNGLLDLAHILLGTDHAAHHLLPSMSPAWKTLSFPETVTDSREAGRDMLFIALAGERTNGHQYLDSVAAQGARGALVDQTALAPYAAVLEKIQRPIVVYNEGEAQSHTDVWSTSPDPEIFILVAVPDTLIALQRLARYHRSRYTPTVVGITGSVGKTSTKEVAAAMISRRYCTLKSKKSHNSEVTVPTTLLRLTPAHEAAVVELGMWAPGELRLLASFAQPHIGVVTNVGYSHIERLGSIAAIANAKAELVEALPPDGIAILNADDPLVNAMAERTTARVFRYGLSPDADVRAEQIESFGLDGTRFTLVYQNEARQVTLPLAGRHHVFTMLAAAAVGFQMGVVWEDIIATLQTITLPDRLHIIHAGTNGIPYTIIDDTYNAAPVSTQAALVLLGECRGRRVALLGDMLELGTFAKEGHSMVGRLAATVAHRLVCVGTHARWIAEAAHAAGMPSSHIVVCDNNEAAIPIVLQIVAAEDTILVKGSRGMAMEHLVAALTAPYEQTLLPVCP